MGILPGAGGTARLPHLLGRSRALEVILSGRDVECRGGGAHRLARRPCTRVRSSARRRARWPARIASMPPASVAAVKRVVDRSLESFDDALVDETDAFGALTARRAAHRAHGALPGAGGQTREGETDALGRDLDAMRRRRTDDVSERLDGCVRHGCSRRAVPSASVRCRRHERVDPRHFRRGEAQRAGRARNAMHRRLRLAVGHRQQPHRRRRPTAERLGQVVRPLHERRAAGEGEAAGGHLPRLVDRRHPDLRRVTRGGEDPADGGRVARRRQLAGPAERVEHRLRSGRGRRARQQDAGLGRLERGSRAPGRRGR